MLNKQISFQRKFNNSNSQIKYNISFQFYKSFTFKIPRNITFKKSFI